MAHIASSATLFVLAGLAEIGGGYLMWSWWRNGRAWPVGLAGALILVLYGIIPTYQTAHFGRVLSESRARRQRQRALRSGGTADDGRGVLNRGGRSRLVHRVHPPDFRSSSTICSR